MATTLDSADIEPFPPHGKLSVSAQNSTVCLIFAYHLGWYEMTVDIPFLRPCGCILPRFPFLPLHLPVLSVESNSCITPSAAVKSNYWQFKFCPAVESMT